MKKNYFLPKAFLLSAFITLVGFMGMHAQVGIGTVTPTEDLHVNGNVRIDGDFKPGNSAGAVDQILLSQGAGNSPSWGPAFINTPAVSQIGKFFVGPFNIAGQYLELTVTDPNMTIGSTIHVSLTGNLPTDPMNPGQPFYGDLVLTPETRNGEFKVHIANYTGYSFTNLQLSFVAFYE